MKNFAEAAHKHLVGTDKTLTIITTQTPSIQKKEVVDEETGEAYIEETSGEENYVYGQLEEVTQDGLWMVVRQTYRGTDYYYMLSTKMVISITTEERSEEARKQDAERAKVLAQSRAKASAGKSGKAQTK